MIRLAVKTMFHEKGRFIITLIGITFSTILVLTQVGIYLGMMGSATAIIRNVDADIWVASKNIQNFDFANPFPEVRINKLKSLPEVAWTEKIILTWGFIKLQNGGQEQVQIVGFNPDSGIGAPWNMVEGKPYDVKGGSYMILDKTSEQRLGELKVGTVWELSEKRFKLVGLSNGIKSFTTSPMVFMTYNQTRLLNSGMVHGAQTSFIVAKLKDPSKAMEVAKRLRETMKDNDVFTKSEFIKKTVMYWTVQTGMGMGFFLTAILGLIVGGSIVGQTIYANTMEHLKEFGTLKALGAKNSDIYKVIFSQAAVNAVLGYLIGALFILFAKDGIEKSGVPLYLDMSLIFGVFFLIALTCILSAFFSVRKIRTIEPAMVFKG